jgi:hypothetical protein
MATDTIQSDTPAINGGEKYAQFFVRVRSLLSDVHGMKSPASFPGVLMDQIIDRGAPTKLISDGAKVETSMAVHDILCTYGISSWQSEPYHQHQNPAERHYQTVKCMCNTIIDRMGAPAYCWLLCLMYVCVILNNTYAPSIRATPCAWSLELPMTSVSCFTSLSMNPCIITTTTAHFPLPARNAVVDGWVSVRMWATS